VPWRAQKRLPIGYLGGRAGLHLEVAMRPTSIILQGRGSDIRWPALQCAHFVKYEGASTSSTQTALAPPRSNRHSTNAHLFFIYACG
jgi:hypothetical protein